MSAAGVLEKIGDWTRSKDLAKAVAKELKIDERTAYRKMEKETKTKGSLIKKVVLPDRSVVYGLSNWPLKEEDLKLLIEALKANALQTMANAEMINALCKLMETTKKTDV